MEGSENTLHRVSRVVWTVWGFLRGSVGRYLRPEVTNEEAHNVQFIQEDTVRIGEGSKEKEEEKEKTETKTSEREARKDLQCPGVSVRAAAVQWEKGTIAPDGHEVKDKSKHTCTSSEGTDEKSQTEKENDTGTHGNQITEQDSPAYIDADVKHGDRTFSGSKEPDLNVEKIEDKKLEEEGEEKIVKKEFDETEEEPIKSELIEQGLLAKEVDLNVERNENDQEQGREEEEEEEYVDGISRREYDETGEELIKSEFLEQAIQAKKADLNVERSEYSEKQGRKSLEEEVVKEFMRRDTDETEEELIKRDSVDQGLPTKEVDLNVERNENNQEQGREEEEECVDEIMKTENDEIEEELIKSESIDQGLLTKEADLNVLRIEKSQEQRRKQEEGGEGIDEIMNREYDKTGEEPVKSKFLEQDLLAIEFDLNVERNENDEEQGRKQEEEEEYVDGISRREYDETGEELIQSEFLEQDLLAREVDLNVERNENDQEQGRKQEEEEYVDGISRREYDEIGEELIQSELLEQDLLAKEVDLNEEQGRKQEEEEEYVDGISRREHDETGEELIQSEFLEQDLLAKEVDLNVERNENDQEQGRKQEEEECVDGISRREYDEIGKELIQSELLEQDLLAKEVDLNEEQGRKEEEEYVDGISRREHDETGEELIQSEFLEQELLAREVDIIVERNENNQVQGREEEEEEEFIDEIITQENDETEEKPIKSEIIDLGVLTKEADINVERSEYSLEQRRKSKEEAFNEFTRTKTDETEEEPIKSESIDQGLLTLEADLNVERIEKSQEQRRNQEEGGEGFDEIMNREYDKTGEELVKSKFLEQDLLAIEVDLNVERNENDEEQGRKQEEEEEYVDGISRRKYDETGEELIQSEFLEQELLAKEDDLNVEGDENNQVQGRKQEEEFIDEIMMQENDEAEEKTIKSEIIDLGLLTKEADINVERSEYSLKQRRKSKEEAFNEFTRKKNDETEEEPIKSECIEQGLLTLEADLNVPRIENTQEQSKKQEEEEEGAEILKREKDETGEEPVKSEFIEKALLAMEDDLNVEQNENDQEQGREEEEECVDEIMKTENDEIEEEPIKSESIDQGLLTKEADVNVLRIEKEQRRKQEEEGEGIDEIMNRDYDKTGEEPVKSKFLEQDLLAKEVDLNVERNENDEEQGRKQEEEEEFIEEIMTQENDETEEPIKSECIEQDLLTVEADLNVERIENTQEQSKKQEEEEEGAEIMKRENDETGEERVKSEFIEKALLAMEDDVNVEQNENDQEQGREEEEECVDEISRREYDETGEEPIKSKLTEQGLLSNEADFERNENNQEQGRKEEEEYVDEVRKRPNNETDEEPIKSELTDQGFLTMEGELNVERNENSQEQEEEGVDEIMRRDYDVTGEEPIKSEFIDRRGEQASVCDMGDTAVVQVISVEESIMECVYDQDKNELNVVEQSIHVTAKHDHEASKSQIVDKGLFIQLASTWEESLPLHNSLKLDVEMTENATLLQETEVTDVDNEEAKQETVGKEKDGYQEEFSAWEQFTGTGIVEEPKVKQIPGKVIDRTVETECDLLETAEMENADKYKKVSEPSTMFKDEDNNLTDTMNLCQLEQSKEQEATSEVALNVDLRQLDDKVHDHNGSQQPAVMTKQGNEGVITRPEKGTGNQMETVETTSMFRAEVAAVDMKKSPERETSSYEQPIHAEQEAAVQEIMGQCDLEKESLLDESADTRIHDLSLLKAPFSEIKSVLLEQADETVVESFDEMPRSSLQELEEFSSEAQQQVGAKSNSPEQTSEVFGTISEVTEMNRDEQKPEQAQPECEVSLEENTWDKSTLDETPLEDQTSQDESTVQDAEASSHRLQIVTEQETLEMQNDSQKGTEDQERDEEAESGFRVASCLGVVEEMTSGLTAISEDNGSELMREMEAPETKEHKNELESCEETSDSKMNVELPDETWECEKDLVAGMTGIESMVVVSAGGEMESVKKTEESITEEEKDECQLVFPESESSKEISKEHAGKVEHEKSLVDSKEDVEERGRPGLKRGFEKMAGEDDTDKPSVLTGLLLPSQASSLDFTAQKSKIAVKNPLVRPPKDPRMLINMASVEPLTPPHPSKPSFLKKSHVEGASVPSKGVIGFKLPGLGAGFPALRKTEAGRKIRDGEDSESVTSQAQKSDSGSQSADDHVKQETPPPKPKWTPPRQPGMGSPLMMAELKSKLKKPAKE